MKKTLAFLTAGIITGCAFIPGISPMPDISKKEIIKQDCFEGALLVDFGYNSYSERIGAGWFKEGACGYRQCLEPEKLAKTKVKPIMICTEQGKKTRFYMDYNQDGRVDKVYTEKETEAMLKEAFEYESKVEKIKCERKN